MYFLSLMKSDVKWVIPAVVLPSDIGWMLHGGEQPQANRLLLSWDDSWMWSDLPVIVGWQVDKPTQCDLPTKVLPPRHSGTITKDLVESSGHCGAREVVTFEQTVHQNWLGVLDAGPMLI